MKENGSTRNRFLRYYHDFIISISYYFISELLEISKTKTPVDWGCVFVISCSGDPVEHWVVCSHCSGVYK